MRGGGADREVCELHHQAGASQEQGIGNGHFCLTKKHRQFPEFLRINGTCGQVLSLTPRSAFIENVLPPMTNYTSFLLLKCFNIAKVVSK